MKVKDLLKTILENETGYEDFLEWDVYTEQISESDKIYKKGPQEWEFINSIDEIDEWEYFKCEGFNTIMPDEKIFTINVNY